MKKTKVLNIYAKDIKGNPVHAGQVERGRKGYYCLGCDKEMEARNGEIRDPYFAHIPIITQTEKKCTYSDETYRHKLAKEILQRIKKVKVPNLYKYAPVGVYGKANKLDDSKYIYASSVKNEIQFYENDRSEIRYGRDIDFDKNKDKHLLIQPDVTFFDNTDSPILFIEVVATHKVDLNKLLKLKRLGINTIQVSIPRESPEAIEEIFHKTNRTEWLFNHEQENAEYIFIPQGNNQRILPDSKFGEKLLKASESFECRSSQIKNLIRRLKQCVGSEPYRSIKQQLRSEISRVERNTENCQGELFELRENANREATRRTQPKRSKLEEEETTISTEGNKFQQNSKSLEERYYTRKQTIKEREVHHKAYFQKKVKSIRERIEITNTGTENLRRKIKQLEFEETEVTRNITSRIREIEQEQDVIDRRRKSLQDQYHKIEQEITEQFSAEERELESGIRADKTKFKKDESSYRKRVSKAIEDRDCEGDASIHGRMQRVLHQRGSLYVIRDGRKSIKTFERIKRILESGEFKKWL